MIYKNQLLIILSLCIICIILTVYKASCKVIEHLESGTNTTTTKTCQNGCCTIIKDGDVSYEDTNENTLTNCDNTDTSNTGTTPDSSSDSSNTTKTCKNGCCTITRDGVVSYEDTDGNSLDKCGNTNPSPDSPDSSPDSPNSSPDNICDKKNKCTCFNVLSSITLMICGWVFINIVIILFPLFISKPSDMDNPLPVLIGGFLLLVLLIIISIIIDEFTQPSEGCKNNNDCKCLTKKNIILPMIGGWLCINMIIGFIYKGNEDYKKIKLQNKKVQV